MLTSRQKEALAFAERIKSMGFVVYLAERGDYGFITDDTESRVLSFSFDDGGSLGGNYGPPSIESGTGWRMDKSPCDLKTATDVREALYANPPKFVGRGWRYLTTVKQHLDAYGNSSRYVRI